MSAPAPRTRPVRRRPRPVSQPLERDAEMPLLRLERAITQRLADHEVRETCSELSAYLDGLEGADRVLAMRGAL